MNNCEWLMNMTYEQRGEWLNAEHVNDDMDNAVNVQKCPDDSREKINALRAYYGAGRTTMTDEQIEAGREVYGARKHVDMVIVDEIADSREKLEADVRDFVDYNGWFDENGWSTPDEYVDCKPDIKAMFIEWLDRQAAITHSVDAWNIKRLEEERESLQDQVDKLQAALDQQRAATANANDLWGRTRDELAAVKAERDNLADDLLSATRERELYRMKCGEMADRAHEMLTLVDLDGEVVS